MKIPDGVSHKIAASIMTKGLTSFYLLYKLIKLLLKMYSFSCCGWRCRSIFSQWAKSLGCKLIGTVGSDEKIAIAKENGCDHVINYNKQDFVKEVKTLQKAMGYRLFTMVLVKIHFMVQLNA